MKIEAGRGEKMVMQVNKYIPHYQRIPTKLGKNDLKLFQEDYNGSEQLQKIQDHLVNFDHVLIESFMGDREKKYKRIFLGEKSVEEQEVTGHNHQHAKKNKTPEITPGYDSDDERENAHMMFIDDLQFLRKTFIQSME